MLTEAVHIHRDAVIGRERERENKRQRQEDRQTRVQESTKNTEREDKDF